MTEWKDEKENPLLWLREYIGVRFSSEEELEAFCRQVAEKLAIGDEDREKIRALLREVFGPRAREVPEE